MMGAHSRGRDWSRAGSGGDGPHGRRCSQALGLQPSGHGGCPDSEPTVSRFLERSGRDCKPGCCLLNPVSIFTKVQEKQGESN